MKRRKVFIVPNLCKNTSLLIIVLVAQLWAIVVALLTENGNFVERLGLISLYSQWLLLSITAVLCALRARLNTKTDLVSITCVAVICLFVFCLVEVASQAVQQGFVGFIFDRQRFVSYFIIAVIFTLLMLRLLSLMSVFEQRNKAEVESRMQALQSRIRPHFLFNSLNTIAELVATKPKRAEQAVESLSRLFRASLETERKFHSLDSELNLCRRYVELETWRYDESLSIDWQIHVESPSNVAVPRLILQPLIENAIVHGVDQNGLIHIRVDIRETGSDLSLMIENRKGQTLLDHDGNGIAMNNIRERLFVLYDDKQTFRVKDQNDMFSVLMRFPKQRGLKLDQRRAG